MSKFNVGDRVVGIVGIQRIGATVTDYDDYEEGYVYCLWDDDKQIARIRESLLELDPISLTPLFQALR